MLMATKALLSANPDPSEDEIRLHLSGNVCRCTGYAGIVAAVREAARSLREQRG
jgi:aerobic-type carbon monoxide dehydrogenase small subunit (CoxS/CutS family)